jgi:calcineurin-like phosphoesterase family protein
MRSRRDFLKQIGVALGGTMLLPRVGIQAIAAARLRRAPTLQRLHGQQGTLLWTTDEPGRAAVELSDPYSTRILPATTTIFSPEQTGLPSAYYQHQADFGGLAPGTEQVYRILMDDEEAFSPAGPLQFRAPAEGPFRFLVFGDSGWGSPSQAQIAMLMIGERPDLAIVTGDLGYPFGTYAYYETNYFDYYTALSKSIPFFPCPGNHDYYGDALESYVAMNAVPVEGVPEQDRGRYYSFDWGNTHFVSLDSMGCLVEAVQGNGLMLDWLEKDLGSTRKFWRVVFFHHPPFAAGPNLNDPKCIMARECIVPLLERHGVQLVFNGHEHSYQRTEPLLGGYIAGPNEGIVYITTGGGGSDLYPVFASPRVAAGASAYHYLRVENSGFATTISAIGGDGLEIDRIVLAPAPILFAHTIVEDRIRLLGNHLATADASVPSEPLPTQLGGTSVFFGGEPLPIYYVSNGEIVARLPYTPYPGAWITVVTPNGSADLPLN